MPNEEVKEPAPASPPATEPAKEEPGSPIEQPSEKAPEPDVSKELEGLKSKYAELETFARGAVARAERADEYVSAMTRSIQAAAARGQQGQQPDIRERIAEDPRSVLDEHYNARTAPIVEQVAENNARMNRELAFVKMKTERIPGTDKTMADVYGEEVDEFLKDVPSTSRAQPGAYEAALRWVRSKHIDEEIAMRQQASRDSEKRTFMEGPSGTGARQSQTKSLTDIEKTVAKGLGLDDKEYTKWRDGEGDVG